MTDSAHAVKVLYCSLWSNGTSMIVFCHCTAIVISEPHKQPLSMRVYETSLCHIINNGRNVDIEYTIYQRKLFVFQNDVKSFIHSLQCVNLHNELYKMWKLLKNLQKYRHAVFSESNIRAAFTVIHVLFFQWLRLPIRYYISFLN